jgi:Winged helix DNA-binding domain
MEWRSVVKDRVIPCESVIPPTSLVIADTEDGAGDAAEAMRACRTDLAAAIGIREAEDHLHRQSALKLVSLDLRHDHGAALDSLLIKLNGIAAEEDVAAIVSAPIELVDCVAARCDAPRVTLLCQPSHLERVAAIAMALAELESPLREVRELDSVRLRRLADEVNRIARTLASLSAAGPASASSSSPAYSVSDAIMAYAPEPSLAGSALPSPDDVRKLIRMRRLRESFFQAELFADPAWDMLLDLFAAHIEGDQVAISSLCIAAAVPSTTALRWIKTMTEAGLFVRQADPLDGRRIFIRLSEVGVQAMASYFAAVRRFEGIAI